MKHIAIVEIPKNNDQRWHLNYFRTEIENFGPIKDVIPVNDGKSPVAYGYLEDIFNTEEQSDGEIKENLDVLIFSKKDFDIGESVEVIPFAMFIREDKDHKIVAHDQTLEFAEWEDVPSQERGLILEFFGYKSNIKEIVNRFATEQYVNKNLST